MSLNVVLVNPVIPQNTGNIARLTAATKTELHLIEPLGFKLTDYYLRRAGLDYWPEVRLTVHPDWEAFLQKTGAADSQIWIYSTHGSTNYLKAPYGENDFLVFGCETKGLPEEFHQRYPDRRLRIPIDNPNVRSLNLSNSVSIALYEARRKLGLMEGS